MAGQKTVAERVRPEVFTPEEAAVYLGVKRSFLYELMADGRLPSFKIGRLRRIRRDDAEMFLDRLRNPE